MPSDANGLGSSTVARALEALAAPREAFDSALANTAEEIRGFLDAHADAKDGGPDRVAAELGHFAFGLIDADRFAVLIGPRPTLDVEALHDARHGWKGLLALRERGRNLHVVDVPVGGDLLGAVTSALAEAGRAFRLARSLRFVRNGKATHDGTSGDPFPPRLWSASERALAPPLVVEVAGADLRVSGLGDLLEGAEKLILLVRGPAAPAPLARLIRPGLLVVQTTDMNGLSGFADFEGPAVAAVLPAGAAEFSHDPRRGSSYARRLVVVSIPDAADDTALEDLRHLRELAALEGTAGGVAEGDDAVATSTPTRVAAAAATSKPITTAAGQPAADGPSITEPVDRLAAWLLDQAGF